MMLTNSSDTIQMSWQERWGEVHQKFGHWKRSSSASDLKLGLKDTFKFLLVNYPDRNTSSELTDYSGCHSSSVSEALEKLRKKGEITRDRPITSKPWRYFAGNFNHAKYARSLVETEPDKAELQGAVSVVEIRAEQAVLTVRTQSECLDILKEFLRRKFGEKYSEVYDGACFRVEATKKKNCEEVLEQMKELFNACSVEDGNSCWKHNSSKTLYKQVMRWKSNNISKKRLRGIFEFPWSEKHKLIVRHDPINCEAYNDVHDHSKCCRPSHLCYGTARDNAIDTNLAKAVRETMTATVSVQEVAPRSKRRRYHDLEVEAGEGGSIDGEDEDE